LGGKFKSAKAKVNLVGGNKSKNENAYLSMNPSEISGNPSHNESR
jgi:hypothetical protein